MAEQAARYELGPDPSQIHVNDPMPTLEFIDEHVNSLYLPFRGAEGYGTERAIFPVPWHIEHQENDAEHSFAIADVVDYLWLCRAELGIHFPNKFDPYKMLSFALKHDILEIEAPDVDAMTEDLSLLENKSEKERAASRQVRLNHPKLRRGVDRWNQYSKKDTPEAQIVSDTDKLVPIRVICADEGRRWHDFEGRSIQREVMCERVRAKLYTPLGHAVMDAIERDLEDNPAYFPAIDGASLRA